MSSRAVIAGVIVATALALVAGATTGTIQRILGLGPEPTSDVDTPLDTSGTGTPPNAPATSPGTKESMADTATPDANFTPAAGDSPVFDATAVSLTDDDGGNAMFTLPNAAPGSGDTGCITVTYHGESEATVRLYGTTTGTGLDRYLDLTVTRGTFPSGTPPFDSCGGFVPDPPDYIGAGAGTIYAGTLADFPDSYDAGLADPPGAPEPWADSETHAYRFAVTLGDDNAAQGLTAGQTFTWEARGEYPPVPIPVVEPTSGPPGTVVTVASGSDPCIPPAGALEPRVWVWTSALGTGETIADITLPVAADGSWSGTVTVPATAGAFAAVEFEAVCFDAAGATAATEATATAYRIYTAVPFTVLTPGTPPADAPAAGTPPADAPASAPPAPPATPVRAQPTFTG